MKMRIISFFLFCFFTSISFGAAWDYTSPVPLKAGGGVQGTTPNANNILFFSHPSVPNSQRNFKESPSILNYRNLNVEALDLVGAPGFPPPSPSGIVDIPARIRAMLADPMGLCFESMFASLVCSEENLSDPRLNTESWSLLVADLRNVFAGEQNIAGVEIPEVILEGDPNASPYNQFSLGSMKIIPFHPEAADSPDAICYDVTEAEDFIACPVFGRIVVLSINGQNGVRPVVLQSPILLYRQGEDARYHLAGHLANPSFDQMLAFRNPNGGEAIRMGTAHFPVAIEHGNFNEYQGTQNKQDIAVFSTATLPHRHCQLYNNLALQAGLSALPHGIKCSYGYIWSRVTPDWREPMSTFSATDFLIAPPKVYDLAAGRDGNQDVLFAPSNAPDEEGRFWVYKYYEIPPSQPLRGAAAILFERFVWPRPIAVAPPAGLNGYGPFKIDAMDINGDSRADFAITWKQVTAGLIGDAANNIWKSSYSSYVSLFLSRIAGQAVNYEQFNYQVPRLDAPQPNPEAELAALSFGEKNGNLFLSVGDNRRVSVDGEFHAFVYTIPINGGVVDNLNITSHRATFRASEASAPGVGDLTSDFEKGIIGVVVRDPFIPAPETCELRDGVYGIHWTGEGAISLLEIVAVGQGQDRPSFQTKNPGVPNRCACKDRPEPNLENDLDGDELVDDPRCDSCPRAFNIGDLEPAVPNAQGPEREQGDGFDDVCDNCPQSFCSARRNQIGFEGINCRNPLQEDRDGDRIGDSCDLCPDRPNPRQTAIYFYRRRQGAGSNFCGNCFNGYIQNGWEQFLEAIGYECNPKEDEPGRFPEQLDFDQDGIPNVQDNCVYVANGGGNQRFDRDQDGSGDICDCPDEQAGENDDCDGDTVPNRFDQVPLPPRGAQLRQDLIYDPTPDFIAAAKDLRQAQAEDLQQLPPQLRQIAPNGRLNLRDFQIVESPDLERMVIQQQQVMGRIAQSPVAPCLIPSRFFPGPIPCDFMGREPRELNALLPLDITPPPPGRRPGQPGGGSSGAVTCIAHVGRTNPKTVALFEADQKRITEANDKIQAITGIPDFDIFVGGEGGIIHWECVFPGGALPNGNVAQAASILPNVSGNFAPFGVWQLAGLPPLVYERKSNLGLLVSSDKAVRLAPLDTIPQGEEAEGAPAIVRYPVPDFSTAAPNRREEQFPTVGVQIGTLRENINSQMVIKVLNSESDVAAEGASLSVGDSQSLFVIDYKAPPECFMTKPIEERKYKFETVNAELERRVAYLRSQNQPVTLKVYEDLPWEACMLSQFLVVQNTIPEARANALNANAAQGAPQDLVNHVILPAIILPPGSTITGGGKGGCALLSSSSSFEEVVLSFAFWLWIFPIPAFVYLRKKSKNL